MLTRERELDGVSGGEGGRLRWRFRHRGAAGEGCARFGLEREWRERQRTGPPESDTKITPGGLQQSAGDNFSVTCRWARALLSPAVQPHPLAVT